MEQKAYYYEYTFGVKSKEEGYTDCDYSDAGAPDVSAATKIWTYIFDTDGTTIKEKYTYYASGKVESKIIPAGDTETQPAEYYHWNDDTGHTLSHKVIVTAETDGTKAYYYEYTSGVKSKEEGYTGCDYSDAGAPDVSAYAKLWTYIFDTDGTTILEKYSYYASGQVESKIIPAGDSESPSCKYYHWNDDASHTLSHKALSAQATDGSNGYYYEYDAAGVKTKEEGYSSLDYADASAPQVSGKLWTILYVGDGVTVDEKYTYYFASQQVESKTIPAGDTESPSAEYYHWNDDTGHTLSHKVLVTAETDGTKAYYYEYTFGVKSKEEGYTDCDYSDAGAPDVSAATKIWTYIFDTDGTTIKEKIYLYLLCIRKSRVKDNTGR